MGETDEVIILQRKYIDILTEQNRWLQVEVRRLRVAERVDMNTMFVMDASMHAMEERFHAEAMSRSVN
jgi:hypothetical protein